MNMTCISSHEYTLSIAKVLVQPRKTGSCPNMTENLLTGCKILTQTSKQKTSHEMKNVYISCVAWPLMKYSEICVN